MANIRTARRSGLVLRGGRNRRESLWVFIGEATNALSGANSAVITNVANAALLALTPFTIVRIRGVFHSRSDQVSALEDYQVAWGCAVVSNQSVAIGVTAIPTPFLDMASDLWLMHQMIAGEFVFVSGVGFHPVGGILQTIDSRAMRKVEEGTEPVFAMENSSLSQGSTNFTAARMLIKLH